MSEFFKIEKVAQTDNEWALALGRFYFETLTHHELELTHHERETYEAGAARNLLRAANAGFTEAQADLGVLYMFGIGGEKDTQQGDLLLSAAASQNESEALLSFGRFEEAIVAAKTQRKRTRIIYERAKRLLKTGGDTQAASVMLCRCASRGHKSATKKAFELYFSKKIAFDEHFFDLISLPKFLERKRELPVSKLEFEKAKNRWEKKINSAKSALNSFLYSLSEKYDGISFFVRGTNLLCSRVIAVTKKNTAAITISNDLTLLKSDFIHFLEVLKNENATQEDIIKAAEKYGIEWADSLGKSGEKIAIEEDSTTIFCEGEVDFSALKNPERLKSLTLSKLCDSIHLPDFKKERFCLPKFSALETLNLPKKVFRAECARIFEGARLKSVDSVSFNVHDGLAFDSEGKTVLALTDSAIKNVEIPRGTENIEEGAFSFSSQIKSVSIPETITEISDGAFEGCTALEKVVLPQSLKVIGENAFRKCTLLSKINIPQNVREIKENAFSFCESLSEIYLPEAVQTLGNSLFFGCKNLERVSIPKSLRAVPKMAFSSCESLETILGAENLETIDESTFENCKSLKAFNFSKKIRSIAKDAFTGCTSIRELYLPSSVRRLRDGSLPPNLERLHYCGTDNNWARVFISGEYNKKLLHILSTDESTVLHF